MSAGSSDEGFEKNKEQPAPLREGEGHTLCWLLRELFLPDRSSQAVQWLLHQKNSLMMGNLLGWCYEGNYIPPLHRNVDYKDYIDSEWSLISLLKREYGKLMN